MTREWDAPTYDALPLPHEAWGAGVLDRLGAGGPVAGERVLDAGCGTGRDAAALLARWPDADLVLVDGSRGMLDRARDRLGGRATYVEADLTRPLPHEVGRPDAVISVAAFHWVPGHRALFAHLARVVRPGGRLVAECGGAGNLAGLRPALLAVDPSAVGEEWTFADVGATRAALTAAGWRADGVRLRPDPIRLEDPALLRTYLATVVLGAHESRLGADYPRFVDAVAAAMDEPVVDYVRLEIEAHVA